MLDRSIVLDSSVIASIYFSDRFSEWSSLVVGGSEKLYTVDLAYIEVSNVAWKRIRLFNQPRDLILDSLKKAIAFIDDVCTVVKSRELLNDAIEVSVKLGLTIYESLYLALAIKEGIPIATLDKKLVKKVIESKLNLEIIAPNK